MKPWEHDLMAQSNTHRESQKGHMRCKAGRRDLRYSFCFNGGTGGYTLEVLVVWGYFFPYVSDF